MEHYWIRPHMTICLFLHTLSLGSDTSQWGELLAETIDFWKSSTPLKRTGYLLLILLSSLELCASREEESILTGPKAGGSKVAVRISCIFPPQPRAPVTFSSVGGGKNLNSLSWWVILCPWSSISSVEMCIISLNTSQPLNRSLIRKNSGLYCS